MSEELKGTEPTRAQPGPASDKNPATTEAPTPALSEQVGMSFSSEDAERNRAEASIGRRRAKAYVHKVRGGSGGVFVNIENFTGGMASGEKGTVNFGSVAPMGKSRLIANVYRSELAQVRRNFVPPPQYHNALHMLRDRCLVILCGAAGLGKFTAALHLVSTLHEDAAFELEPGLGFDKFELKDLGKRRGFVIDTLGQESAMGLHPRHAARVARDLGKAGHHLVVTLDNSTSLPLTGLSDFVVRWNEPPDAGTLLRSYLQDLDTNKVSELAGNKAVQALFRSHPLPGDIVLLAGLLRDVIAGQLPLEDVVNRFEGRVDEHVARWFEEHTTLEERTLLISLAVFNGSNYQNVADADRSLQSKLRRPVELPAAERESPLLGKSRRERLETVSAVLESGFEDTEFGRIPVEIVKFKQDAHQRAVLRFFWHEYDGARGPVLQWLRDCALHSKFDVRAAAAAAAGELSRTDFGLVVDKVIRPWADQEESSQRIAAAIALGIPAWSGELAPQVLNLLHYWSTVPNWKLTWTAATAYGDLTGLRFPDLALQDLRRIAERRDPRLLPAALHSLQRLFDEGSVNLEMHSKIIFALGEWVSEADNESGQLVPLWFFLKLAHDSTLDLQPSGVSHPTVAWLAWQGQPCQTWVVELLVLSLNHNSLAELTLEILRRWIEESEDDPQQASEMENLLRKLAGRSPRDHERIVFHLERWAAHSIRETGLAAKLRTAIDEPTDVT